MAGIITRTGFLRYLQRDVDSPLLAGRGAFYSQLQGVESVASVASGHVDQVVQGILVQLNLLCPIAALGVMQRVFHYAAYVLILQRAELEDARA